MLILPYQTRFTARSLPIVTLLIAIACVLVYFVFQRDDAEAYRKAVETYAASELPKIELPRYEAWLLDRSDKGSFERLGRLREFNTRKQLGAALSLMENDSAFMHDLRDRSIVKVSDPKYDLWARQRKEFDAAMQKATTERFSLRPEWSEPWRFITHQFLHGDFGHLLGNMIVLLVAGPFAEAGLGRFKFLLGYLAGGAVAGVVHLLLAPGSLIGASGAISAAMAMVAVIYGRRKVPVFYWIFVYFDTARLPALAPRD